MMVTNATGKHFSPQVGNLICPGYSAFIDPVDALQANCQTYTALNHRNIFKELFPGQVSDQDVDPDQPSLRLELASQVTLDLVYETYLKGFGENPRLIQEARDKLRAFFIDISLKSYLKIQEGVVTGWLFTLNMTTGDLEEIFRMEWDQPSIHLGTILANSTGGFIFEHKTGWLIESFIEDEVPFGLFHRKITYNQQGNEPELLALAVSHYLTRLHPLLLDLFFFPFS